MERINSSSPPKGHKGFENDQALKLNLKPVRRRSEQQVILGSLLRSKSLAQVRPGDPVKQVGDDIKNYKETRRETPEHTCNTQSSVCCSLLAGPIERMRAGGDGERSCAMGYYEQRLTSLFRVLCITAGTRIKAVNCCFTAGTK